MDNASRGATVKALSPSYYPGGNIKTKQFKN